MFAVDFLVEDKNLAKVLLALDKLVLNLHVLPVRNAKVRSGKVTAVTPNGTVQEAIRAYIANSTSDTITTRELGKIATGMGKTKEAYAHTLRALLKERILKRGPKRVLAKDPQVYHILKG